jgi:hypothetical protein
MREKRLVKEAGEVCSQPRASRREVSSVEKGKRVSSVEKGKRERPLGESSMTSSPRGTLVRKVATPSWTRVWSSLEWLVERAPEKRWVRAASCSLERFMG